MKIVEENRDRMVVKRSGLFDRIWTTFGILIGLTALVWGGSTDETWLSIVVGLVLTAGSVFFRLLSADLTVTLDRRAGMVEIEWVQFFGTSHKSAPLDQVVDLVTEGDDEAERLVFEIEGRAPLPLTPFLYTGGDHPEVRSAIKDWLPER